MENDKHEKNQKHKKQQTHGTQKTLVMRKVENTTKKCKEKQKT